MESLKSQIDRFVEKLSKGRAIYVIIFALWLVYLFLSLTMPTTQEAKDLAPQLSELELDLIRLTVALPYLLIWLAAAYSFKRVRRYSKIIEESKEAQGFSHIATGLLILLVALLLSTAASTIDSFVNQSSGLHEALTITTNYFYIFPYLIAFWFFLVGGHSLSKRVKRQLPVGRLIIYGLFLAIFTYFWLDLIFTNQSRKLAVPPNETATYYLRDSLIVLTIVIPSVIAWTLAILSVINLKSYILKVKGIIYRQFLSAFVLGVWGVVLSSIFLQGLLSLGSERLLDLGLGKILGVIYFFFILQIFGFLFIARGAKRLTKIERV